MASYDKLLRSIDQGKTFNFIGVEFDYFISSIAITPNASSPIYVGTDMNGIYKSSDGGSTWVQKNQGLPLFGGYITPILSLAVDPNHPETVWAGTGYSGGIVKSIDGGEHWSVKGLTQEPGIVAIAVRPDNSNEILAGAGYSIYKSTDGGSSWRVKLSRIAFVTSIVFDQRASSLVYAATEGGGVLQSTDGGETWHDYSNGIFYPMVYSLAITPGNSPRLIAGSYGSGLYWIDPSNHYTLYTLTATKTGSGTGTVTSQPAGIDCGSDCTEDYASGTKVTLTATPDAGSTFAGWSNACTTTALGDCQVTMNAAKSVKARLRPLR